MKYLCCAVLGLAFVGFTGCGGGPDNNSVVETDYQPAQVIKEGLEGVKSTGRIGSNFSSIMMAVRDLKKTDSSKGEALEKELHALTELKDASKIKAKAAEIISKM